MRQPITIAEKDWGSIGLQVHIMPCCHCLVARLLVVFITMHNSSFNVEKAVGVAWCGAS